MIHHRYAMRYPDGEFHNIYENYICYYGGLVCGPDEEIFDVTFEETIKSDHEMVAWKETGSNEISMIFINELLLSVCFPYGLKAAISAGQGHIVYLKIKDFRSCGKAGALKQNRASWDQ